MREKVEWLEYTLLASFDHLQAATFLRRGGVSEGVYKSLNGSLAVGDHPEKVMENREIIRKTLQVPKMVFAKQNHGTNIFEVTKENIDQVPEADVLITKEKGLALAMTHADCQVAMIFDPKKNILGIVHAGWRGQAANIYEKTIRYFVEKMHSSVKDLFVAISPSLGPCHAENVNYKKELPEEFFPFQDKPNYFDFWKIASMQLTKSGILENQIEIAKICTYANEKDYFSYRREKHSGRNVTVLCMQ